MISGRNSETTYEQTEKRKPGNTSSVTAAPPRTWRRSSTSTIRPARARYAAAVRPLCPPPITMASYFIRDVTSVNGCPRIPNSKFLILNFLFVHHPALHHPRDALERGDVAQWIAADRDQVGELARFDRAGAIAPAHDLGGRFRGRYDRGHRRLTEPDPVAELARVLPVRHDRGVRREADRQIGLQHHLKRFVLQLLDLLRPGLL